MTKEEYLEEIKRRVKSIGYELVDDSIYGTYLQVTDKDGNVVFINKPSDTKPKD